MVEKPARFEDYAASPEKIDNYQLPPITVITVTVY